MYYNLCYLNCVIDVIWELVELVKASVNLSLFQILNMKIITLAIFKFGLKVCIKYILQIHIFYFNMDNFIQNVLVFTE